MADYIRISRTKRSFAKYYYFDMAPKRPKLIFGPNHFFRPEKLSSSALKREDTVSVCLNSEELMADCIRISFGREIEQN